MIQRFDFDCELSTTDGLKTFSVLVEGKSNWTEDTVEGAYHPDGPAVWAWYLDDWILTKLNIDGVEHPAGDWRNILQQLHVSAGELENIVERHLQETGVEV